MRLAAIAAALALGALAGCSPGIQWPPGFVEVGKENLGPYAQRAVSADGVVVALRTEPNPKNAAADFWATAIRDELVSRRGYALAKEEPLTSADGAPGRLLTFTAQRSGVEFTYLTAVYVRGQQVLLAEAGGKSQTVAPKADELRKSLASVRAAGP